MILITGGSGFIGAELVRKLAAKGHDIRAVGRGKRPPELPASAEYVRADLVNIEVDHHVFDDIDKIVHLATTTLPASSMRDMIYDASSNISLGLRLLEASRQRHIGHFIFASSGGTVYGQLQSLPAHEEDETNPLSSYGVVKLTMEKYVSLYAHQHGLRGVILRIANPYGPGQLKGAPVGAIANFLKRTADGEKVKIYGDGEIVRDYIHIDDTVSAFVAALENENLAGVYNIGSGEGTSLNGLLEIIGEVSGRRPEAEYLPARGFDVDAIYLDAQRFVAASGWRAQISLKRGIGLMWDEIARQRQDG
jgi:UDP-glucose 4-epimerase